MLRKVQATIEEEQRVLLLEKVKVIQIKVNWISYQKGRN